MKKKNLSIIINGITFDRIIHPSPESDPEYMGRGWNWKVYSHGMEVVFRNLSEVREFANGSIPAETMKLARDWKLAQLADATA